MTPRTLDSLIDTHTSMLTGKPSQRADAPVGTLSQAELDDLASLTIT